MYKVWFVFILCFKDFTGLKAFLSEIHNDDGTPFQESVNQNRLILFRYVCMLEIGIKVLSADLVLLGIILLISITCTLYAKDTVRLPSGNMNKFLLQPIHRVCQAKINIPLKDLSTGHPVSYKHVFYWIQPPENALQVS